MAETKRVVEQTGRENRSYLNIANRNHGVALTRLLVSNHCDGIEVGQVSGSQRGRARLNVCRYCEGVIEPPERVLLKCTGNAMIV